MLVVLMIIMDSTPGPLSVLDWRLMQAAGIIVIKNYRRNLRMFVKVRVFEPSRPFQSSPMFVGIASTLS
jgi:hypothetical protein